MVDLAKLGAEFDASGLQKGMQDLEQLTANAQKTEKAVEDLAKQKGLTQTLLERARAHQSEASVTLKALQATKNVKLEDVRAAREAWRLAQVTTETASVSCKRPRTHIWMRSTRTGR